MSMPQVLPVIGDLIGSPVQDFDAEYEILRRGRRTWLPRAGLPVEYMFGERAQGRRQGLGPRGDEISQMDLDDVRPKFLCQNAARALGFEES
jgi:hypothetical protein